jgi:hypothetical protein
MPDNAWNKRFGIYPYGVPEQPPLANGRWSTPGIKKSHIWLPHVTYMVDFEAARWRHLLKKTFGIACSK